MSVRLLVGALAAQFLIAGIFIYFAVTGFPFLPTHAAGNDDFDGQQAYADVRAQVARGPRPAGSEASRQLAVWLRARLPHGTFEAVPGGLRDVVGSLPGRAPAIEIGAPYDTAAVPGLVGADDPASGAAVVLELARALVRSGIRGPHARAVRFVLWDGSHADRREAGGAVRERVTLGRVGASDLRLRRPADSDAALWARLRSAADEAGVGDTFPTGTAPATGGGAGSSIPTADLTAATPPCTTPGASCDTLAGIDADSLDAVGEALVELVHRGG